MTIDESNSISDRERAPARVTLVTGGSRSGKSSFAERIGEALPGRRVYLATCPRIDDEMNARIERHRSARAGKGWETIEEPLDLAGTLAGLEAVGVVLVDCLTLWVNNLLYEAQKNGGTVDEDEVVARVRDIRGAIEEGAFHTIFVTNEVGLGVVPGDPVTRRYRDLVGRCNQEIAKWADDVVLMTAGLPLHIKRGE